jgi:hypothetical protein
MEAQGWSCCPSGWKRQLSQLEPKYVSKIWQSMSIPMATKHAYTIISKWLFKLKDPEKHVVDGIATSERQCEFNQLIACVTKLWTRMLEVGEELKSDMREG